MEMSEVVTAQAESTATVRVQSEPFVEGEDTVIIIKGKNGQRLRIIIFDLSLYCSDFFSDIANGIQLIKAGATVSGSLCLFMTTTPGLVLGLGGFLRKRTRLGLLSFVGYTLTGWVIIPIMTVTGYCVAIKNPTTTGHPIPKSVQYSIWSKGMEGYLEGAGQLVLNVSIVFISGYYSSYVFPGDAQILSILLSFISVLKTAGEQHFFVRSPSFPGKLSEVLLASITFLPDLLFRIISIAITVTFLRLFSFFPLIVILLGNYVGTGMAGITDRGERMVTSAVSVVIPTVYADYGASLANGVDPQCQKYYYSWNRNVLATVLCLCVCLVLTMVRTDLFDSFQYFCYIHDMPECSASLHLTAGQLEMILLPLVLATGLLTLVPQVCGRVAWLNKILKYDN